MIGPAATYHMQLAVAGRAERQLSRPGRVSLAAVLLAVACGRETAPPSPAAAEFELSEASVSQLQDWMTTGRYTSRRLVELYLQRIAEIDAAGPACARSSRPIPDALAIADALDAERKAKGVTRPAARDSVCSRTTSTPATGCDDRRLARAGERPAAARRLRRRTPARRRRRDPGQDQPERVGQLPLDQLDERLERARRAVRNPYVLDRNPCGSSSGTGAAIAANLAAVARRHRDRRLDRLSGLGERARRHQADGRPGQPHGIIPIAPARTPPADGAHGGRRRRPARGDGRRRSARRGDRRDPLARSTRASPALLDANALRGARIGVARAQLLRLQPAGRRVWSRRRSR